MTKTRVGVVRGGPSNEYDVSLQSGAAVLGALDREKYEPIDIFISKDGTWHVHGVAIAPHDAIRRVDVIFNALHGYYGEDGKLQHVLETHGVPFTGSRAFSSSLAMAKHLAKEAFNRAGLQTPLHVLVDRNGSDEIDTTKAYLRAHSKFPLPYVVKPASGGSSVGVALVKDRNDLASALDRAFEKGNAVLVEEFIAGVEASVGVIDGFRGKRTYALPPIEIRKNKNIIFDYGMKYREAVTSDKLQVTSREMQNLEHVTCDLKLSPGDEIVPATFSSSTKKELERLAIAAHEALGLSHYSRSDFIVTPHRGIYILETNSLPGLTALSLVPKALAAVGASMADFTDHVIRLALDE